MKHISNHFKTLTLAFLLIALNPARLVALNDAMKIKITGNNYSDETVIRFVNGATADFDGNWDAWKFISPNPNVPSLYTSIDSGNGSILSINAYPELNRQYTFDLYTLINAAGIYTIRGIELGSFASNACIVMEDLQTGNLYDLRDTAAYSFSMTLMNSNSAPRLRLHFSVAALLTTFPASCSSIADGSIIISKAGDPDFSVFLQDSTGNIVAVMNNINETDTLSGLSTGAYTLTEANNSCGGTYSFIIHAPLSSLAGFTVTDTLVYLSAPLCSFTNISQNASAYDWNFGDNTAHANTFNATHTYAAAGIYTVTLIASNGNCQATFSKTITVQNDMATSIHTSVNEIHPVISSSEGTITVILHGTETGGISVKVFNLLGAETGSNQNLGAEILQFSPASSGIYMVMITKDGTCTSTKVNVIK